MRVAYYTSHDGPRAEMETEVFRYQLIEFATGDPEGVPYRYIGRALMRMWELNAFERSNRYSLKPIRSRE